MDDDLTLDRSLRMLLLVGERARSVLAARQGLTAVESAALSHLASTGPLTQRQLGDRVGLSTGAVTGLVDRLEKHGVCRREPHPTDRRSSYVQLTDHGRTVLALATDDLFDVAGVVSPTRRDDLAADLVAIAGAMSERVGGWRGRPGGGSGSVAAVTGPGGRESFDSGRPAGMVGYGPQGGAVAS